MKASISNSTPDQAGQANEPAIHLNAVSVRYQLFHNGRPQLQDYAAALFARRTLRREVWALRDVTLNVARGEVFGLCGANGSGKSTLLKLVARILRPSAGRVIVRGRVAPLIELGAGFQHDLTGRENILLKSAILGHSERDTRSRIDRIVDFAGLREFIDAPVRTYSSGMVARLAFAVATDIQPDILIIDEVLSVGDAEFRERSEDRIDELRRAGATVLIVSHNSGALRRLCDRVAWLAYGSLQMEGEPAQVIRAYEGGLRSESPQEDGGLAESSAPQTVVLGPDDTMFLLELPGSAPSPLVAAVTEHFDPQHICPLHSRADVLTTPGQAVAPFRLLHGPFFYDQAINMLQRAAVVITELRMPPVRGAAPAWAAADNPITRMLGQRAGVARPLPLDRFYLEQPVSQEDAGRASAALDQLVFVGLAERPRESLLLLWYTFGWPPGELPRVEADQRLPAGELPPADSLDSVLYTRAVRRFTHRFDMMAQELIERYGGPLTEHLEPPYPLELLHGLLIARHRSIEAKARRQPAIHFTFDRPVPGVGWYGIEYSQQHGTFRWTGPETLATIQLPIERSYAEHDLMLRCRILLASRAAVLRSLRFTVNRRPIAVTQSRSWDGSIICEGIVPAIALAGSAFALIALEVDRTEVPPGNGAVLKETRQLGVAVSWLELAPVAAAEPQQ